jgi:hypothetical protein
MKGAQMAETADRFKFPSAWRMVHDVDDSSMQGRRYFYFESREALLPALEAYRQQHLARGWVEAVYGEHLPEGDNDWERVDA